MEKKSLLSRHIGFLAILLFTALLFFLIARPFLISVLLAFIVAGVSRPLYLFYFRLFGKRAVPSSLCSLFTILLGFFVPLVIVGIEVVKQGIAFFQYALDKIPHWAANFSALQVKLAHWLPFLKLKAVDWAGWVDKALNEFFKGGLNLLNQGLQGAGSFLLLTFVFVFCLYYFYIDWKHLLKWLMSLSPLAPAHNEKVSRRFADTARSVLKTMVIIGVLQGVFGGIAFALAGIPSPIFWGFVLIMFSLLPVIGTGIIWLPAALIKLFTGHLFGGILIMIFGIVVVVGLENLVRPRLVGGQASLHPLPVFIGTLGGIAFFGISGFILGPLTVAVLSVLLEIYRDEIRPEL